MQINNISFGNIKKTDNTNGQKTSWFNRFLPNDKFVKSEISREKKEEAERAAREFGYQNGEKWGGRFNYADQCAFKELYKKGAIDIETVDKFALNTKFDVYSISKVYVMGKELDDKNFADKVIRTFEKCDKTSMPTAFEQSKFEPFNEFKIEVEKQMDQSPKERTNYYFDVKSENLIGKSSSRIAGMPDRHTYLFETKAEDYRNNLKSTKVEYYIEQGRGIRSDGIKSETIEHYTKEGKLLRKDVMEESQIEGVHNLRYEFPNGKSRDVVKATVDPKTGIKTIKKDMRSSDGTKTEFLYEDDPNGNRLVDYKITDTNGNVLMKNSQTFEVIDKNHFVSSKNGHVYDIKADEKSLTVKDLKHSGKEVTIEFKKKIKGEENEKNEIINLLKKVPGEELFEVVDCVKKIKGKTQDKVLDSHFNQLTKNIQMADNLFVFLHELGHAKDSEFRGFKDLLTDKNHAFQDNPYIQQSYLKERQDFNKKFPHEQREHVGYFTQAKGHYGGAWGGLQEIIAETNAITNSYTNGEVKLLSGRSQYLQQHFPKTIAAIQNAMNYKNDIEAIEYYGT